MRKTCAICVVTSWLLIFSMGSTLGVKHDLILALRIQILEYLLETFTGMPWSTYNRLVQKKKMKKRSFFSTETAGHYWPLLTLLEACGRRGHVCATCATPRPCTQKKGFVFHLLPLLLFMAVSMILKMWRSNSHCTRRSWRTEFGTISLNQLVDHANYTRTAPVSGRNQLEFELNTAACVPVQ